MKDIKKIFAVLFVLALAITACAPAAVEEAAVEEPAAEVVVEEEEAPAAPECEEEVVVEFWSTDNEEDRIDTYEAIAAGYMAENPCVDVRIVPIDESSITQRVATSQAANRLPDIIRMGVEIMYPFALDGLLSEDAAGAVIAAVGEDDFRAKPLEVVTSAASGNYMAVPFDGWVQALWYRTDVFSDLGLAAPTTWDAIDAACDALPGTGNLLYALGLGTAPAEGYPHQVFEQVAMSNNAWPFDADGNVTMDTPEMIAALKFYTDLQRCAIPGPQFWKGARESYELDQSGMLVYSTYIMDDLVDGSGIEGGNIEIAVEDLAEKSGFAPLMEGPGGDSASYGQLVVLALTTDADPEAQAVVEYFLTKGYIDVLKLSPMGKVPVLKSALAEWKGLSEYFAYYSDDTLTQIADGFETANRWLYNPAYGPVEIAVIGDIQGRNLISQVISNIALEKTMTPETAAAFLQEQVEVLLADRSE